MIREEFVRNEYGRKYGKVPQPDEVPVRHGS